MLQPEGVIGPWLGALADMEPDLPTVVIVEDHRVTRRFLADNLAADGYEPVEAESAAGARRVIEECFPAAAIIDLGLPDRDGLDLLRELRQYGRGGGPLDPQLPVLILSGRATELDRVRGFERGCDDYLAKVRPLFEPRDNATRLMAGDPALKSASGPRSSASGRM